MTRPGEWHLTTDPQTRCRLQVYAAMHGLTLGAALKQLLDLGEGGARPGMGAGATPRTAKGRAGVVRLRTVTKGNGSSQGHDQRGPLDTKSDE